MCLLATLSSWGQFCPAPDEDKVEKWRWRYLGWWWGPGGGRECSRLGPVSLGVGIVLSPAFPALGLATGPKQVYISGSC